LPFAVGVAVFVSVVEVVSAACVVSRKPPMIAAKATTVSKVTAMIFLFMLVHLPFCPMSACPVDY
jgi:hypothetical protein